MSDNALTSASRKQNRVSDPESSAWVSANAGSGKTHVLVNRVIRLLLTGTPPQKILCLTFTRAAAAEMSTRLFKELSKWIAYSDEELTNQIHEKTGHYRLKPEELALPRQLFALALETPGGLKIQTIHAFCEQLLQRFPVEAGITPGFEVLDDRARQELISVIKSAFVVESAAAEDAAHRAMIETVTLYAGGESQFDELLGRVLAEREKLRPFLDQPTLRAVTWRRLADGLGIDPLTNEQDVLKDFCQLLEDKALEDIAACHEQADDVSGAEVFRSVLKAGKPEDKLRLLSERLLTAKGEIRSRLCLKKVKDACPWVEEVLQQWAGEVLDIRDKLKARRVYEATIALIEIAAEISNRYEREKSRLGHYDYADLISRTYSMLEEQPGAAWVLYRLDDGIDHILVDEAQDTSPEQWNIIWALSQEFFAGEGAREDLNRTVFAVGDPKQSIFSFQGAAPDEFDRMRKLYAAHAGDVRKSFADESFEISFRSADAVLKLVDKVFAHEGAARGVDNTTHMPSRADVRGLVELWEPFVPQKREKKSAWQPPDGSSDELHQKQRLATRVADEIAHWLDEKRPLVSRDRPVRPEDILILVRNRTRLMDMLVRALKLRNIPVAGVDRLKLTRHIAVQDLMALARFVLTPDDDLNFAGLLKSSLLADDDAMPFDDEFLISLGNDRRAKSLWQTFSEHAVESGSCSKSLGELKKWVAMATRLTPYVFFSQVLNEHAKRKAVLTRLGSEANEALDAFLSLSLEFEQDHTPSLQGFLSWLMAAETEIKRDMEQAGGEVRIMTVHGAKGLESKIVILPDTCDPPDGRKIDPLLFSSDQTPVWRLKSDLESKGVKKLKSAFRERAIEEYNRLLYVAMTRAEDELYICGAQTHENLKPESWYQLIANVLKTDRYRATNHRGETVWRFETGTNTDSDKNDSDTETFPHGENLPEWALTLPPREVPPAAWLSPSLLANRFDLADAKIAGEEIASSPLRDEENGFFRRGTLVHKLLQYLPDVREENRKAAALAFLEKNAPEATLENRQQVTDQVIRLVDDPQFAEVFSYDGKAEVAIAANVEISPGRTVAINGRIDRLSVTDNRILIVDFKTGRPLDLENLAGGHPYVRQLAAYRLALRQIYPSCPCHAALLWTDNATLCEIPEDALERAFANDS